MRLLILALQTLALAATLLASNASAQTDWSVEVRDFVTGQGIPNVKVDARTSQVQGWTDSKGVVTLSVTSQLEDIIVQGHPGYNYHVGSYVPNDPKIVYLVPDSAYHK